MSTVRSPITETPQEAALRAIAPLCEEIARHLVPFADLLPGSQVRLDGEWFWILSINSRGALYLRADREERRFWRTVQPGELFVTAEPF